MPEIALFRKCREEQKAKMDRAQALADIKCKIPKKFKCEIRDWPSSEVPYVLIRDLEVVAIADIVFTPPNIKFMSGVRSFKIPYSVYARGVWLTEHLVVESKKRPVAFIIFVVCNTEFFYWENISRARTGFSMWYDDNLWQVLPSGELVQF